MNIHTTEFRGAVACYKKITESSLGPNQGNQRTPAADEQLKGRRRR